MSPKEELTSRFIRVRQATTMLCSPLKEEDFVSQPVEDVSPPKWHLGHTTWFFEKFILERFKSGYQAYNPHYNYFFNSYYESAGDRLARARRGNMTRPTTSEIIVYREFVDHEMLEYLESTRDLPEGLADLVELGIHHEQQHQELLITDIKYILGHNPLHPVYADINADFLLDTGIVDPSLLVLEEGLYEIGHSGEGFSFDNELARHKVYLASFGIMDRLVTNGEYLEFLESGGYEHWSHWLSEAWHWIQANEVRSPLYWQQEGSDWFYYTLAGYRKLDLNAPVCHISYYEADAYAGWKGKRLPTEFEWEAACQKHGMAQDVSDNLLDSGRFMPIPVQNNSKQFYGDVWEWTASAYLPYPGYNKPPGAVGEYNGKFMINQMVLRGGSCATPLSHIRPTYRNFFQTDKRWQFKGFRLAETI